MIFILSSEPAWIQAGKNGARIGAHWRPERPESSPKGLRNHVKKQETHWFNCILSISWWLKRHSECMKRQETHWFNCLFGPSDASAMMMNSSKSQQNIGLIVIWTFCDGCNDLRNAYKSKKGAPKVESMFSPIHLLSRWIFSPGRKIHSYF